VIGKTSNTDEILDKASPRGIITPRSENFHVANIKFYNYNWQKAAALGSCSHCFFGETEDGDGRTVNFKNLKFTDVTRRIRY
jgi:hypothetical protein